MARRKNIFDFASKELSATAFWAWILDAEHSSDAALSTVNAGLRLNLAIPADAVLETIELEKNPDDPGLKLHTPSDAAEYSDRKRIDILATYRLADGDHLHLVIENKVRRDPDAIEQVTGYRDRLQRRVSGPVRAAVFTFDNSLAASRSAAERSVTVFTLAEMVALLDEHASSHAIVDAYVSFLKDKLTIANATPVRGPSDNSPQNLARWAVVADQKGIRSLLDTYLACAERHGFTVTHSKGRSIFLTINGTTPVISVHPSKSSAVNGLWFGLSITNLTRTHHMSLGSTDMPDGFAWRIERQSDNEWRFGYLNVDEIASTVRMVADRAAG